MKIAHIGAGYWGKNIVRNLAELGVLGTICDSNAKLLESYNELHSGVQLIRDYEEVLADAHIDAVSIATPVATHYELTKQALTAGKDVFVEKPLALQIAEGAELATLAQENGRILMVGHILRYHPAIQRIKELIDNGTLGRVGYCYSNRLNLGKVRKEENILWSFAPHDISVLLYLVGGPPDEVHASGEVILQPGIHDVTLTTLKWNSGISAHINVSWLHPFKEHKLVVVGDKAMLVFDDTLEKDKLALYDQGIDFVKGQPVKRTDGIQVIDYERKEPLRLEMQHFLECVKTRVIPRTDAAEALQVLKVLQSAQLSLVRQSRSNTPAKAVDYHVHPSAVIDAGAQIGRSTRIWHFSHVMSGAKIGAGCSLGQNVFVANNVVIGRNVKIQNNVSIYEGVTLEDDVFCGPSMVFTNIKNPRSAIPRNTSEDYLATTVRRGATLGANCTVVCGITIGQNAFVAAGAVATKDVKPNALMAGVPAKQIGWMCNCGFRLAERGNELVCPECSTRYVQKNGSQIVPR